MKSNLFFRRLLLLWVFAFSTTLWGQYNGTGTFTKINSVAEVTDGYYVIANSGDAIAMNSTNAGSYFTNTAITPSGGTLTNPASSIVWKIESSTGGRTIYSEATSKYVSYTGTKNEAQAVATATTNNQKWMVNYSSGTFEVANLAISSRLLKYNPSAPRFACYTSGQQNLQFYKLQVVIGPTLSVTPTALNGFTYIAGSGPSTEQTFTVSGTSLADNITVTAPANFEVSTTSGVDFGSSVTLAQTDGTVASTTVYARMIAGLAVNDYSGNIVLSSVDATDVNVALSGNVTPIPSLPVVNDAEPIGKVGETFSFQVIASNYPTNYFVSSETLPVGLSLDGNSGLVTGTPTQAGEFITGIKATNVAGTSPEGTFIFTISKGTQTVILPDVNAYLGGDTIILPETTDKGFPIEYVSDDETVASVSGNVLTIVGLGSTEIFAGNDGDSNYNLFTDSFSVVVTETPAGPCGMEDFSNIGTSSSYGKRTWTGFGGTWTATDAREDQTINGKAITIRTGALTSPEFITGIGNLTITTQTKFGGSGDFTVKINGLVLGTIPYSTTAGTFSINNINIGGDFIITVENTNGNRVAIDDLSWTCFANPSTTWDGTSWSNGDPDATKDAIIAGTYNKSEGITAKTITVNAGISWIVNTFANVENVINNGEIIVANYANFVQSGSFTPAATGSSFKVSRATKPVVRLDYNSWSSPIKISTQKLTEFSPGTLPTRFLTYSDGTFSAITSPELTTFTPGAGYLIRTSNTYTTIPTPFQGLFEGTEPNSGDVSYVPAAVVGQYVFLGNPYPSAISMADFKTANSQFTTTTFYIWNSESKMNTENKYENAYITHSETGSVPPGIPAFIPVGQGFIVDRGSNTGNIYFNNNMRRLVDTGTFAKGPVTDKFWLQLVTPNGVKPQMLIGFSRNGTSDYDAGYDAKIFDNSVDALYSTLNEKSLVINTLGNFNSSDEVNVTANTTEAGNYTISIVQKEGVFTNGQVIYLKDNVTGTETELTAGAYTFTSNEGVQADRFTVTFSKGALASGNVIKAQSTIYANNQMVYVKATSKIGTVDVYDMSGKLMKTTKNVNADNVSLPVTYKGIAVVKLLLENGEVVTKKIILK